MVVDEVGNKLSPREQLLVTKIALQAALYIVGCAVQVGGECVMDALGIVLCQFLALDVDNCDAWRIVTACDIFARGQSSDPLQNARCTMDSSTIAEMGERHIALYCLGQIKVASASNRMLSMRTPVSQWYSLQTPQNTPSSIRFRPVGALWPWRSRIMVMRDLRVYIHAGEVFADSAGNDGRFPQ